MLENVFDFEQESVFDYSRVPLAVSDTRCPSVDVDNRPALEDMAAEGGVIARQLAFVVDGSLKVVNFFDLEGVASRNNLEQRRQHLESLQVGRVKVERKQAWVLDEPVLVGTPEQLLADVEKCIKELWIQVDQHLVVVVLFQKEVQDPSAFVIGQQV